FLGSPILARRMRPAYLIAGWLAVSIGGALLLTQVVWVRTGHRRPGESGRRSLPRTDCRFGAASLGADAARESLAGAVAVAATLPAPPDALLLIHTLSALTSILPLI